MPTPQTPSPTASDVIGEWVVLKGEGDEAVLRNRILEVRQLVDLAHEVSIPEQYRAITKQVRTPFVRDTLYRTTAALTQHPPQAHIEPRDETQQAKQAANIAEAWTMAAIERLNRDLRQDVLFEAPLALIRDGESVIKVVDRLDAWANFPQRERGERAQDYLKRTVDYTKGAALPFAWRVVDRLQMVFDNGEFGDSLAIEYGEYPRAYLAGRYGMQTSKIDGVERLIDPKYLLGGAPKPEGMLSSSRGRSVKYERWSADWWAVVIDGTMAPGFPRPNPYVPKIPYIRAKTDSQSVTVLYALLYLVPLLDSLLTMKTNWAYLGAYPNPVIESVPNQATPGLELPLGQDDQGTKLTWRPGKVIQLPIGKRMSFLVPPPIGKDIDELINIVRGLIEIAGIPSAMRGGMGGDSSGYLANQMLSAAMLTYRRLSDATARQFEEACEFLWWLVRFRVQETVYVLAAGSDGKKWLGLKPDGSVTSTEAPVDKLGPLEFTFKPVLPTDEQAKAMIAVQLRSAGLISKRYAREHLLNIEDPESMDDEIAAEDALDNDPTLHKMVVDHALAEAGIKGPPAPPDQSGQQAEIKGPPDQSGQQAEIPPGPGQLQPQAPVDTGPGALSGVPGVPSVPGLTMPMQPGPPVAPARSLSGVPGAYPGLPGGQGPPSPFGGA